MTYDPTKNPGQPLNLTDEAIEKGFKAFNKKALPALEEIVKRLELLESWQRHCVSKHTDNK